MRSAPVLFVVSLLFLFTLPTLALADDQALPRHNPVPGGVAVIELPESDQRPAVRYRERSALVVPSGGRYQAVLGIPLSASTGQHEYQFSLGDDDWQTDTFHVSDKEYAESRITIEDESMVTPDEEAMKRINQERPRIRQALSQHTDKDDVPLSFILPVEDVETSPFGRKRFINDQPRNPHGGIDIRGATGTPIVAPGPGTVIETGDYYFNGKTVFLDHGQGLVSMFCHMDEIEVSVGDELEPGDRVGTVGMTGRVTGPHLHWSVSLGNTMVNPRYFLEDESPLDASGDDE
ncbi:murein DD-endopeptidase MepM/ murein hydrolase activator NlpD [Natronospira proteinivora]|uniref:Murein DD-endopeptidase MepM/ murein hydrolase activator NlpD n=1 Tax=Natronospira proteinivora TaxID=1807133 RepID=A0ABT1G7P3_9GAMM|nr:peptidoglycan DD-metalloendopeptidase family protein [Natronospira proteinivora]MCP1727314.1 murein DD-endopeptidase MepM/ murein hydrolase activator NlpD [Natronospira proteinivora]